MKVKGKAQGLALYEILDPDDPLYEAKSDYKDLFETAVRVLESSDSSSSASLFKSYQAKVPLDPCLDLFLERAGKSTGY